MGDKISGMTAGTLRALGVASLLVVLGGCQTIGYYSQAITGQLSLLSKRRPIEDIMADPATPDAVREKLALTQEIRAFASEELGLPVGDTYRTYADLDRQFVVWNVFVAPEFSVELTSWCYPIAGCVTYRGYFSKDGAMKEARRQRDAGSDVYVGGVDAFSTLGWFDDAVLNTFIGRSDVRFAGLLFHELAHKAVYVPDDTTFNESFATAVERAALERWLQRRGEPAGFDRYLNDDARKRRVIALIVAARDELEDVYARSLDAARMREEKSAVIERLRADYRALGDDYPFRAWMDEPINNAKLGTVATYNRWVPAFLAILEETGGDLPQFLERVEALASRDEPARNALLASKEPD